MPRKLLVAVLAVSILLSACQQIKDWTGGGTADTSGSKAAGSQLGSTADFSDHKQRAAAEQRAYTAPIGQQITWSNPGDGDSGTITPVKDGYSQQGAYCRELQQTITGGGQQKQTYSTTCQQPDGSWKIVNQQ